LEKPKIYSSHLTFHFGNISADLFTDQVLHGAFAKAQAPKVAHGKISLLVPVFTVSASDS
jgi:hypothetical protein